MTTDRVPSMVCSDEEDTDDDEPCFDVSREEFGFNKEVRMDEMDIPTVLFSKLELENPDGTANLDFEIETEDVNERQELTGNS